MLVAEDAEVGPAQQFDPCAAFQARVQVLPVRGTLAPLPQQRAQRLAWQGPGELLVAAFGKTMQREHVEHVRQVLRQAGGRYSNRHHHLVLHEVQQQLRFVLQDQRGMPLPRLQALAQRARDRLGPLCAARFVDAVDRGRHPPQRALDGTVVEYAAIGPLSRPQLAVLVFHPELDARTFAHHAQRGVAQRRRVLDHQQVALIKIATTAHGVGRQ